jgi:putative oxidoreductase
MFTTLQRYSPQLLSLMRIAMGITFIEHGTQKLFAFPAPPPGMLPLPLLYFTGILETVGGSLIAVGLFTRVAAFLVAGEMAVGYWWMHVPRNFFPMLNGGEIMVLYCFAFLYIAAVGPGPWSLDAKAKRA